MQYIYISTEEMRAVAEYIKKRGRIAIAELAAKSNTFIDLEAKATAVSLQAWTICNLDSPNTLICCCLFLLCVAMVNRHSCCRWSHSIWVHQACTCTCILHSGLHRIVCCSQLQHSSFLVPILNANMRQPVCSWQDLSAHSGSMVTVVWIHFNLF